VLTKDFCRRRFRSVVSAETLISNKKNAARAGEKASSTGLPRVRPAKAASDKSPATPATNKRKANKVHQVAERQRVLVVDDVADVTEMIALFLKHAGFEVATANSAQSALRLSSENHFDLIISDIGMPEMNGYDLAESLRRQEGYDAIPMIAVTGYTEYDDFGRSLAAGFNAHLTKPINPAHLLNLIGELLA